MKRTKQYLMLLLDEVDAQIMEENPLEDLDSSIIEMGRPVNPNETVIESPIYSNETGVQISHQRRRIARIPNKPLSQPLQLENQFDENGVRGDANIQADPSTPGLPHRWGSTTVN